MAPVSLASRDTSLAELDRPVGNDRRIVQALESLEYEIDGPIVTVWLSRPPVNAVDQAMYRSLEQLFSTLPSWAPDVRAVVLAGRGRHFCAGNDLEEFRTLDPANAHARMREVRAAFFAIQDAPVPVVGAVQGSALGTGLAIAASCDLVVAAEGAKFGVPEVSVGVMGGARHLMRLVPQPVARWMYFSAEPVGVEQLMRFGAVLDVVPPAELLERAHGRAALIARHSPVTLRYAKSALNRVEEMPLQVGYEYEQTLTGELSGHPHAKEALNAVREGRPANYDGASA
jgi:enoyl-CoA hydratase